MATTKPKRTRKTPRAPMLRRSVVNRHIGARVKESRYAAGLSIQQAADKTGVTPQQWNRYENGVNAIGAEVMVRWLRVCGKSPNFFFEGVPLTEAELTEAPRPSRNPGVMKDAFWIAEMLHDLQEEESRSKLRWFLQDYARVAKRAKRQNRLAAAAEQKGDDDGGE